MAAYDINNYEQVHERIPRFYEKHPDGRILTRIDSRSDDFTKVLFVAELWIGDDLKATGWAYEEKAISSVNKDSWIENCETSAIGRALANYNLSGSGKPRPSREEMAKVQKMNQVAQPPQKQEPNPQDSQLIERLKALRTLNNENINLELDNLGKNWTRLDNDGKKRGVEFIEKIALTIKPEEVPQF